MSDYNTKMKSFRNSFNSLRLNGMPNSLLPFVYPFPSPLESEGRIQAVINLFQQSLSFIETGRSPIGRPAEPRRCLYRLYKEIKEVPQIVKQVLFDYPDQPFPKAYGMDKQIQQLEYMLYRFSFILRRDHTLVEVYKSCLIWATTPKLVSPAPAHDLATRMSALKVDKQGSMVTEAEVASDNENEKMAVDVDDEYVEEDVGAEEGGEEEMDGEHGQEDPTRVMEVEVDEEEEQEEEEEEEEMLEQRAEGCKQALHKVKLNALFNKGVHVWHEKYGARLTDQQCLVLEQSLERELRRIYLTISGQLTLQMEEGFIAQRLADPTQTSSGDQEWADLSIVRFDVLGLWGRIEQSVEESINPPAAISAVQQAQQHRFRTPAQETEHRRLVRAGRARRLEEGRVTRLYNEAIRGYDKEIRSCERQSARLAIKERLADTPARLTDIQDKIKKNQDTLDWLRRELRTLQTFSSTHLQDVHERYIVERMEIEMNSA